MNRACKLFNTISTESPLLSIFGKLCQRYKQAGSTKNVTKTAHFLRFGMVISIQHWANYNQRKMKLFRKLENARLRVE